MNLQVAQDEFRTKVNELYTDFKKPVGFFTTLAEVKTTSAKTVGSEIMRGYEKIAVDVIRGASGHRNELTKSTQKFFTPPYYNEEIDFTQFEGYDRMFGMNASADVDINTLDRFTERAAFEVEIMSNTIRRSIELQGSQVFDTGIVTLNADVDIDFKRTALSKPDIGGVDPLLYWGATNAVISEDLNTGARYMREVGKSSASVFTVVMGSTAWEKFRNDPTVQVYLNTRRADLIEMTRNRPAQNGATAKCIYGLDSFTYNIWVMENTYDNASNAAVQYWDKTKVCMYPEDVKLSLQYAGIPTKWALNNFANNGGIQAGVFFQAGEIIVDDYIPETGDAHIFRARSAPLYKPTSIDKIYSFKAVA